MMQLVVGWTLVGGFVFTAIVTCLSLVGLVKFADPRQQGLLFKVLVLQLMVGAGGKVAGAWRFDAGAVSADVYAEGALDGGAAVGEALTAARTAPNGVDSSRAALVDAFEGLRLRESSSAQGKRAELVTDLRAAQDQEALARTLQDVRSVRRPPR